MNTVKVRYTGPGSDTDKRLMEVTPDEARRLENTGLWTRVTKAKKTTKKETNDG